MNCISITAETATGTDAEIHARTEIPQPSHSHAQPTPTNAVIETILSLVLPSTTTQPPP